MEANPSRPRIRDQPGIWTQPPDIQETCSVRDCLSFPF
jgi:hypothetical protein